MTPARMVCCPRTIEIVSSNSMLVMGEVRVWSGPFHCSKFVHVDVGNAVGIRPYANCRRFWNVKPVGAALPRIAQVLVALPVPARAQGGPH